MHRRALIAVPLLLLVAACATKIDPTRAPQLGEITVTPSYADFVPAESRCAEGTDAVEIFLDLDTPDEQSKGSGAVDAAGDFVVKFDAPEPAFYEVTAVCAFRFPTDEPLVLDPDFLTVTPELALVADPDELAPEETFTATGTWCVSQSPDGTPPHVAVTFEGETQELDADSAHPYGEAWDAEFTAPAAAGVYEVTATCTYDTTEYEPPAPVDATAASADVQAGRSAVDEIYDPAEVTVVVPEEPVTPVAPAPAALPTKDVRPTFTG